VSKLYLIRHAQASFLSEDYDNLSEHGHAQSLVLGEYFVNKAIKFDEVYIGPLRRHRQTYLKVREAYVANGLDFPKAIEIEELREYEGMDSMEIVRMKMVLSYLQMWATNTLGFDLPEGVQTFADFRKTAEVGLQKILTGNEKGKTIVAFSSGGCIAAMMAKIVGVEDAGKTMGFNLVMLNTAITEVLFSGNRLSLQNFNTLPHLNEAMVTTM